MEENGDIGGYLAQIKETVRRANEALSEADLRLQETDRFLESQGLSREQVLSMEIGRDQLLMANEELKRRGLPPLEASDLDFDAATESLRDAPVAGLGQEETDAGQRAKKFGFLMREFRL